MMTRLVSSVESNARAFAQQRRLAHARRPSSSRLFAGFNDVAQDVDRAEDGAADAAGQANDAVPPVADRGDAVQRAFDAGAIVLRKGADTMDHVIEVFSRDRWIRSDRSPGSGNGLPAAVRDPSRLRQDFSDPPAGEGIPGYGAA